MLTLKESFYKKGFMVRRNILLIILLIIFTACETGTRYDKNASIEKVPKKEAQSGLVNRSDIEALLDDDELLEETYSDEEERIDNDELAEEDISGFSNGTKSTGLDVRTIREGKHESYVRLVFDIYDATKAVKKVGHYEAKYTHSKKDIAVILDGYEKFSAPLPSFSYDSIIEQIYFEQYPQERGFKFHIKLRQDATVKIFDLENPARIVFDIKAI